METSVNTTAQQEDKQNFFSGSVPRNYDTYLGPILFTPYAIDLVARIRPGAVKVLELAAGTGRVTTQLVQALPAAAITVTDISDDMMAIAKEAVNTPNITWQNVNMADIPFAESTFDAVVCQFGLMFVPDRAKALKEMYRVLAPGGQLLLSTWGSLAQNPVMEASFTFFESAFGQQPFQKGFEPFSLADAAVVQQWMHEAGFNNARCFEVHKTVQLPSAADAAKAFMMTWPPVMQNPGMFAPWHTQLTAGLQEKGGDNPFVSPLLALVFEGEK
ncbi:MAG TPA: class I SAM-dependent methyltransferase [Chitinophagaceae bacterium]|nr:class I SAM-dependent methyltransferase [Chitinophagaceae bacterium]